MCMVQVGVDSVDRESVHVAHVVWITEEVICVCATDRSGSRRWGIVWGTGQSRSQRGAVRVSVAQVSVDRRVGSLCV